MISKIKSCYRLFPTESLLDIYSSGSRYDKRSFSERRQILIEEVKDEDFQFLVTLGRTKLSVHLQLDLKDNYITQPNISNSNVRLKLFLSDNSTLCMNSEFSIGHKANLLKHFDAKETIFNFLNRECIEIFSSAKFNKTEAEQAYEDLVKESGVNEAVFTLNKNENKAMNKFVSIKFHFDIIENDGNLEKALFYAIKEILLNNKTKQKLNIYLNNWNTEYLKQLEMEKVSFLEEYIIVDPLRNEEDAANNNMSLFFLNRDKIKMKIENLLTLDEINIEEAIKQVRNEFRK